MATYIEYKLDDDTTILIEAEEQKTSGVTKAGRDKGSNVITSVNQKFEDAIAGVKKSAQEIGHCITPPTRGNAGRRG